MTLKHFSLALLVFGITVCGAGPALADGGSVLPLPGLTPSNFFYFLDRFGETLQDFFTFGVSDKAKLQVQFAAERVAEISLERKVKGEDSPGVEIAKERFTGHLKRAEEIIDEAEERGEEIGDERAEVIEGVNEIFENADWLDDFYEEFDEIGNSLGIPDEGEFNEEDEDELEELEELEFRL